VELPRYPNRRAGRNRIARSSANMASNVIPTTRNGSDRSHNKGQRTMTRIANGQHTTNRRHQPTITSNAFTGVSPRFLGATLAHPRNAQPELRMTCLEFRLLRCKTIGVRLLAIMSQRKSDPNEYEESADAAIEPLLEFVAGPESAADSRRRPRDEQIPNRAVEIEDRAQE